MGSASNRPIIPCSMCGLYWHLDCLDPPLANPPINIRQWKCPCHVDDLLFKVPGLLAPAHKFRKIKGASAIQPGFGREYINNGYIEVDEDESGWKDARSYGRTVRLPAQAIMADFMFRVRQNRKGKGIAPLAAPQPPTPVSIDERSLEEKQAALNLAQFSGDGSSGVTTLVDTLVAEADPAMISLMARSNAERLESGRLSKMDQQSLRGILAYMEEVSSKVRGMLEPIGPVPSITPDRQTSPQPAITDSGSTARDPGVRVPSLTNSQSTEAESEVPASLATMTSTQLIPMETDGNKLDVSSPASSEGVPIPTTNGDLMDETTTTTVLASAAEAFPRAMSKSPVAQTEPVATAEPVDARSNAYAPIVIEASPEPVVNKTTSTAASPAAETAKTVMVIDSSESGSDDKNAVLVVDARQVEGDDKNDAVEMDMVDVSAPVIGDQGHDISVKSEHDGRDAENAMDLD